MRKKDRFEKGITLISLIITIVIMLILAAVALKLVIGDNGLFKKAKDSASISEISSIKEEMQTELAGEQINENAEITKDQLENVLEKYGKINYDEDGTTIKGITTFKNEHEILLSDIWNGTISNGNNVVADGKWNGKVNTPKLVDGMTGVYWDNQGKEVKVNSENQDNWYDYSNHKWANAVTADGSYWVWIPRYEYKILDKDISIKFIPTSKIDVDSDYKYIHPAFRDGSRSNYTNGEWNREIPGFWIAKYQVSMEKNGSACVTDSYGVGDVELSSSVKAVSKPGVSAWRNLSVSTSYKNAYNYDRSKESHLVKNSEWGAVAYLTQSMYGKNKEEITINDDPSFYTAGSANAVPTIHPEESTTGNPTGVFDMSGCTWERIAGYITNGHSNLSRYGGYFVADKSANSNGYKNLSTNYATVYPYNSLNDDFEPNWKIYNSLKSDTYGYGDAILETSTTGYNKTSWNNDYSCYPLYQSPFFVRGGSFGSSEGAGIFAFGAHGDDGGNNGFRIILID